MPIRDDPRENQLLAALPRDAFAYISRHLELVPMPLGQPLIEPGHPISGAYFPTTAVVSLLSLMQDGAATEVAVVGCEGIVGVSLFMGGDTTPSRSVVHSAGHGFRMKPKHLKEAFDRGGPMQQLLLRYTQALLTQMAQTAVCNRHHTVDQQLCRWLLLNLDRLQTSKLEMTQELMAHILGVRREGITASASKLQRAGLIRYHRGHITVLDRPGLEARACECYAVVRTEYARLGAMSY